MLHCKRISQYEKLNFIIQNVAYRSLILLNKKYVFYKT